MLLIGLRIVIAITFKSVLFGLIASPIQQVNGVLKGISRDELKKLFSEYHITQPAVVTAGRQFISYDLKNAAYLTGQHHARRIRRSNEAAEIIFVADNAALPNRVIDVRNDMYRLPRGEPTVNRTIDGNFSDEMPFWYQGQKPTEWEEHHAHRYLHFNVSVFNTSLHLRVERKDTLIAPGAKSVIFTADGQRIVKDLSSSCLFFGKIQEHPKSKVVVSNCNGLAGLIQKDDEEFFIEPLENQEDAETPQSHVVYKRSVNSQNVGKRMDSLDEAKNKRHLLSNAVDSFLKDRHGNARRKRGVNRKSYNIEILLTAGSEVVQFHGRDVENYLLTLTNIVDEIYQDQSLGERVNIILSRLYLLDEERTNNLIKTDNPKISLRNVCKWSHKMQRTDPPIHGKAPDYSIFLTRKDFGPAGYAHVAGMCQPLRSCSLTFEDGFSSAFVVAHETGHVLGMEHDGEGNRCGDETSMGSIMAPLVQSDFHRYHWSRCSQRELQINLGSFLCLRDDPHSPDWGPVPPFPGVTYSLDDQCRFDFGQGYKRCTAFRNMDVCRILWCSHDDNPLFCKTKKGPPVDGTECGDNMWCFKSHCVWKASGPDVNGNWGTWSSYTQCSRSCGIGVKYRSRLCNNPAPSKRGADCVGQNIDYELCNKRSCPKGKDFRADQCMYRNNEVEFKNQRHKWLPYEPLSTDLKCELYCVSKKTNDVVTMGDYVADGTRCSYDDPHGICVRGECVDVGCDRVIGSSLREDICGVCGGSGSSCRNVTDKLTKRTNRKINSYKRILKIPSDARYLQIRKKSSNNNSSLLALKSRSERRYLLNSKSKLISQDETPHRWISTGALWTYDNSNGVETIAARGPISSDVILMILVLRRNVRVSITYSYIISSNDPSRKRESYRFEIKRWTSCSVTCGSGFRRAKYGCRSQTRRKWVSKRKCKGKPPRSRRKSSNVQSCHVECRTPARWVTGGWTTCSSSCGSDGWQERSVNCQRANSQGQTETVNEQLCLAEQKPDFRKVCYPQLCPPQWRTGPWSQCSVSCGRGLQRRQVRCKAVGRTAEPEECSDEKPILEQECETVVCPSDTNISDTTAISNSSRSGGNAVRKSSGICNKPEPALCGLRALAQYCKHEQYKTRCCKSCRAFEMRGTKTDDVKDMAEHRSGKVNPATSPTSIPQQTEDSTLTLDGAPSRKKRSTFRDPFFMKNKNGVSKLKQFLNNNNLRNANQFALRCRLLKLKRIGPRINLKYCGEISHRKVFQRSNDRPYWLQNRLFKT